MLTPANLHALILHLLIFRTRGNTVDIQILNGLFAIANIFQSTKTVR